MTSAAPNVAPLLEARRLRVSIGGHQVCRDLSFSLAPGERLAILGRNGAGKSTLLATLAGLRRPDAGELWLGGQPYAALGARAAARRRGFLPQRQGDAFPASVIETALLGRHPHLERWGWESAADQEIARSAIAAVGLAGMEERDVRTLSGGERQRLAIATLLTQRPPLYLLDEPLAHLDLNHQIAVLELFCRAASERQAGVIMVLHDPNLAGRYAERSLIVDGKGDASVGASAQILTAANLSQLYGHPLKELGEGDGERWFVPS